MEIRELNVAELDQVSGGGMFDLGNQVGDAFRAAIAAGKMVGNIAGQVVGGGSQGAGPAGGGKGGAGPVPA